MSRTRPILQTAFALTMIALGVTGMLKAAVPTIWNGVPRQVPGQQGIAYLCAGVSLASGAGLLWRRTARFATALLLLYLLLWLLAVRVPDIAMAPTSSSWWGFGETAALLEAGWVLYVWSSGARGPLPRFVRSEPAARITAGLYGLGLIPFGIAHFTYFDRTVSMVPAWLPWHSAFAVLTGGAFIAAGVSVLSGVGARLAAALTAWQIGLFTLLVWGPVVLIGRPTQSDWQEIIVSWVLTVAATIVASSYHGATWLGVSWPAHRSGYSPDAA
ncbi:MAG: hypothetical protein KGJ59_13830 [Bacteroidota bacterium]|nr:hypothetical protein [Bacteroidota bacterium]